MLTHRNFVVNLAGLDFLDAKERYNECDVYLSYLPLAHVLERMVLITGMVVRMEIGFFQGDVLKLIQDLAALKPTVFVSVPRL